jgi:uncharacterized protein YjbJ (UPF0337 family)
VSLKDKLSNKVQSVTGQAKRKTGEATDDPYLEAEGRNDQTKGDLKDAGEKVKDAFKS